MYANLGTIFTLISVFGYVAWEMEEERHLLERRRFIYVARSR